MTKWLNWTELNPLQNCGLQNSMDCIVMGLQRVGQDWETFTFTFGFNPWVGKIPWRRKWQPTPVFLPGKSHGWRSLAGYSPWGRKELDMTERITPALVNTCISLEWNLKAWSHLLEWRPPHFVHPKKITWLLWTFMTLFENVICRKNRKCKQSISHIVWYSRCTVMFISITPKASPWSYDLSAQNRTVIFHYFYWKS